MKTRKVLIIEDDQRIAQTISKGLSEKDFETAVAFDGKIGLKMAQSGDFDLVLLDLNLPELNGYQVAKTLRLTNENIPIIMLTALGETEDKIEGFESGADDYMVKPFDFRELLARINSLLKRKQVIKSDENELVIANLTMNLDAKTIHRDNTAIQLTPKEFGLLEFLIRNKNKVVSKSEIAEAIWDQSSQQSLNVIEVYINFLRKKIDKEFEPKLIHTKSGMGYVLKVD